MAGSSNRSKLTLVAAMAIGLTLSSAGEEVPSEPAAAESQTIAALEPLRPGTTAAGVFAELVAHNDSRKSEWEWSCAGRIEPSKKVAWRTWSVSSSHPSSRCGGFTVLHGGHAYSMPPEAISMPANVVLVWTTSAHRGRSV
jgi:hypothetical protein